MHSVVCVHVVCEDEVLNFNNQLLMTQQQRFTFTGS